MKIQIEPTDIFAESGGSHCRVWNGITEDGRQCFCFIAGVAVRAEEDPGRLADELFEAPIAGQEKLLRGMR